MALDLDDVQLVAFDLELVNGRVQVAGTPNKGMTITEIAHQAYSQPASLPEGVPPGLEAQVRYTPDSFCTWSNACHICVCEVDPATGAVEILRYVVSEDCGVMINPNVVEGQTAGGVVQGIGAALFEHCLYDERGQLLNGNMVDYLVPMAAEMPDIECGHVVSPTADSELGAKGAGEAGTAGAPACVMNAINDALRPLDAAPLVDMPFAPGKILAALGKV